MFKRFITKIKKIFKESETKDINTLETVDSNEEVKGLALKDLEIGKHYLMLKAKRDYRDKLDMESDRIFVSGKGNYYPINRRGYIIKPILYPEIYYYEVNCSKYKSYKGYVQKPDAGWDGKLSNGDTLSQYELEQYGKTDECIIFLEEGQPNTKELAKKFFMNKINQYMSKYKNKQNEEYLSTQKKLLDEISKKIDKL